MAIFHSRKSHDSDGGSNRQSKRSHRCLRPSVSFFHLLALIFLILVCIGNLNSGPILRDTYFLNIDLSHIIPRSVPNAVLINSIARSIGLHDFYQVGLWNFCEGYKDVGITYCSPPKKLYWFNPVEILVNELLAGATIALPGGVTDALKIVKIASQWMFGCFITATALTFLAILIAPLGYSSKPRWLHRRKRTLFREMPIVIFTFATLLLTFAASAVATIMFTIFRNVFQSAPQLNVNANLGIRMLVFMWIATACNLLGFLFQAGMSCGVCCCSGKRKALQNTQLPSHTQDVKEKRKESGMKNGAMKRFVWKNRRIGT